MIKVKCILIAILGMIFHLSYSQHTELKYLSGVGLYDTKTWDFYCSEGMNSKKWKKIEVPSQWELQGFGAYTYGRFYLDKENKPSDEWGIYKYDFDIPDHWKGKQVSIVFEGVMTDAKVKINNLQAGDIHQGGFYRFDYDITDKLQFDKPNSLEVKVWKESTNHSVNNAERRADWWLYGGIYRPVYLKASPTTHIDRIAVDAQMDGTLNTEIYLKNLPNGYSIATSLIPIDKTETLGRKLSQLRQQEKQIITTKWEGIKTWDSENPNLYTLRLELLDQKIGRAHV